MSKYLLLEFYMVYSPAIRMDSGDCVMSNELNSLKEKALSPGFDIEQYLSEDRTYFKKNLASIRAGCGSGKTHSFFSSIFKADVPEGNGRLLNILVAPQINMLEVSEHNREQGIEKNIPILCGFSNDSLFDKEKMKAPLQGTMRSEQIKSLYNIYECFEYLYNCSKVLGISSKEQSVLKCLIPGNMKPDETVDDDKGKYTKLKIHIQKTIHDALSCIYCNKWDWNNKNIDKKKHYIKDIDTIYSNFYKDITEKDIKHFLEEVYEAKEKKSGLLDLRNKGIDINKIIMNIVVRIFMPVEISRFRNTVLTMTAAKFNEAVFSILKYSNTVPQGEEPVEVLDEDLEFDEEELSYNRSSLFYSSRLPSLISLMGKDGHHSYLEFSGGEDTAWGEVKAYLRNELTHLLNDMALDCADEDRKGSFFSPSEIVDICMDHKTIGELFNKVRENSNNVSSKNLGGRIDYLNKVESIEKERALQSLGEDEKFRDKIIDVMLSSKYRTPMLRRIRTHLNEYEEGLTPENAERRRRLKGCCYRLIMFTNTNIQADEDYYQFSDRFTPFVSVFFDEELAFHKDFVDRTSKSCVLMRTDKGEEVGDNYFGGIAILSRTLDMCSNAMDTKRMSIGKDSVKNYSRIGNMFVRILKGSMIRDDDLFKVDENGNEVNLLEKSAKDIIQGLYEKLKPFESIKNGILIKESDLKDIGYTFNSIPMETIKSFDYVCVIDTNRRETVLMPYNDYSEIKDDNNISMVSLEAICYLLCILDIVRYNIGADSVNKYIDNRTTQDSIGASLWKNIKESRFIEFDVSYGSDNRIVDALSALLDVSIYASLGIIQGLAQNKDREDGYIYVGLDMRSLGVSPESMVMMMLHNSKCRCVMMSATSHIPGSVARYFNVDNMKRISKDYFDRPYDDRHFLKELVRFHRYENVEVEIDGQIMGAGEALKHTTLQRNKVRGGISFHRVGDKEIKTLTMTYGDDGNIEYNQDFLDNFDNEDVEKIWFQNTNTNKKNEYGEIERYINLMIKYRKNALIMANSTSSHINIFIEKNSLYNKVKSKVDNGYNYFSDFLFDEGLKKILQCGDYLSLKAELEEEKAADNRLGLGKIWKAYSGLVGFNENELTPDNVKDKFKGLPFMGGSIEIMKSVVVMTPNKYAYNSENSILEYSGPGYTYLMAYKASVGQDHYFRDFLGEGNSDGLHEDTRIILVSAYDSSKQGVNFKLKYKGDDTSKDLDALCLCNLPYWNEIREEDKSTGNFLELKKETKKKKKTSKKSDDKSETSQVLYRDNSLTSMRNRQVHKNIMAKNFHGLLEDGMENGERDFQSLMLEARERLSEADVKTIERVEQCYCSNLKGSLENIMSSEVEYAQCEEIIQTMGRIDRADRLYQDEDQDEDNYIFRFPNIFFSEGKRSNVYQFMASMFQRLNKLAGDEGNDLFLDSLGMTCMSFMTAVTDEGRNPWFSHSIFREDATREAFKERCLKSYREHEKASHHIYGYCMERMREGDKKYKWLINFNRIIRDIYGDGNSLRRMYDSFFGSQALFTDEDLFNLKSCPPNVQNSFITMLTHSYYLRCTPVPSLDKNIGLISEDRKYFKTKFDEAQEAYGFLPLVDTNCCDDTICSKDRSSQHVLDGQAHRTINPSMKIETIKGARSHKYLCDAMEGQPYEGYLRSRYKSILDIYLPNYKKNKKDKIASYKEDNDKGVIEIHNQSNGSKILTIPQDKETDLGLHEEIYIALDESLRKVIDRRSNNKNFCLNDLKEDDAFKDCFPSLAMLPVFQGNIAEYIVSSTLQEFLECSCSYYENGQKFSDILRLNGNTNKSSDFGEESYKIEELYDICLSRVDDITKSLFIDVKAYARGLDKRNLDKVNSKIGKIQSFMKEHCKDEHDTEKIKKNVDYIMLNIFSEEKTIGDRCDRIGLFMPMLTEATRTLTKYGPLYYFNSLFVSKIANLITHTNS